MLGLKQPSQVSGVAPPTGSVSLPNRSQSGESLQRNFEDPALIPVLTVLWLASTFLRFSANMFVNCPSIFTDELTYWSMARSFHHGMRFITYNIRPDFPSQLYPILLSPLFSAGDSSIVYVLVKLVNCILFCSVVFPAYFLARELLDRREALIVAMLSLLIPGGSYTATVMAENLYYPAFVLSAWLAYRALYRGKLRDGVLAGFGFGIVYFVKPHVLFLMMAYGLAVAIWFANRVVPSSDFKVSVRNELPGLLRRALPFGVFAWVLPIRYLETAGPNRSLALILFGESYLGTVKLGNHSMPLGKFLESGGWLFAVLVISTAFLPLLAVLGSAFQWKRLSEAQRWFWVLTICAAGVFLVMISRHNVLNDGILRSHERYVFQLSPLFFTWYFSSRMQLPVRWLVAATSLFLALTSVAIARSSNLLTWNNSSDSPTLSGMFWMHMRYHRSASVTIVVILLCGVGWCLMPLLLRRRPMAIFLAWAIFLIGCNAGWYGLRLKFLKPEVRRFNDLAMYLKVVVPRNDRVGILEDEADARAGWYANFWLSQPFYFYGWHQYRDFFAEQITIGPDGSIDFGDKRPQLLLASETIALPYPIVQDFPEVHLRMYRVPPAIGTK